MSKERILILDKQRISLKLQRMAYQVWEANANETAITLVGVQDSGLAVAKSLAANLRSISKLNVNVVPLKINKRKPLAEPVIIEQDLTGQSVVLVDDVANSGKTLLYGLKPLLDFEVKKILIAVLVDRKHKSFPITPDIVGHTISTTLQEHIEVETNGDDITAVFLQ